MNAQLDMTMNDGGVVHDLGGLAKPAAAVTLRNRCREYIRTMNDLRKPCREVAVTVAQYSVLFAAAIKGRDEKAPPHLRAVNRRRAGAEAG